MSTTIQHQYEHIKKFVSRHCKQMDWNIFLQTLKYVGSSVTRLGNLLHFRQLFKACGNYYFAQIAQILVNFCKCVKIFLFSIGIIFGQLLQTFWRLFTSHTGGEHLRTNQIVDIFVVSIRAFGDRFRLPTYFEVSNLLRLFQNHQICY